ncbi:hypothetical protein ILUMI_19463 [Ignelater luminosus]|uniref:Uncharacterized protein n=1 Tax=Ignelater luminosus TaxID=2038154 RepID=A0A8K0FZW7_IGNLU|nr:hypothetical protein ILUMI_19463 [Ignelater luminosus]
MAQIDQEHSDSLAPFNDGSSDTVSELIKIGTLYGHTDPITVLKFSSDGKLLASAGLDGSVKIWDAHHSKLHKNLIGHTEQIRDLAWSNDGTLLASASMDRTVRLWDVLAGKCLRILTGHTRAVFRCIFNPRSSLIASGSTKGIIHVWDVKTGNLIKILQRHSRFGRISSLCFTKDGSVIISGSIRGNWCLWDLASEDCLSTFACDSLISSINMLPTGNGILIANGDGFIEFWDTPKAIEETNCFTSFLLRDNEYISMLESPAKDDLWIVTKCQLHYELYIWSLGEKRIIKYLKNVMGNYLILFIVL